jgi:hypothetical protein
MDANLLKELGLDKASETLEKKLTLKRKLTLAYEHYKFVEPHTFNKFNKELRDKTFKIVKACPKCENHPKKKNECDYCRKTGAKEQTYDKLIFVALKDYAEIPPPDCLLDLKKAKDRGIFDTYEVAKVKGVIERPDPIIFGMVEGCSDKFFITQWDDDVSIEQIMGE